MLLSGRVARGISKITNNPVTTLFQRIPMKSLKSNSKLSVATIFLRLPVVDIIVT